MVALPAIDVSSLGSALGSIGSISVGDIATQAAMGALVTMGLAGFKSQEGQNAIDPLHIFHKDGSQTVIGNTKIMPLSVFKQLDAAGQANVLSQGYTVVNG